MNRDLLNSDVPSRTCLDSIWREPYDLCWLLDNQPLFVVLDDGIYKNADCRAPELEISADCDVQVKVMITV